jgi:hypothetical protein
MNMAYMYDLGYAAGLAKNIRAIPKIPSKAFCRGYANGDAIRVARKPQTFDTSPLPLFGDGHKQKEMF